MMFIVTLLEKTMKLKNALSLTLLLSCALMTGASADIKYTQTMTVGSDPNAQPMMRTGHFVAPGKERDDTEMTMGNHKSKEGRITICATQETIRIDDTLKIYTIEDEKSGAAGNASSTKGKSSKSNEKAGTGKYVTNVKITDLKPEKVANWDTKHYMVEMRSQGSGCVGNSSSYTKMELWVADVKDAHGCKNSGVDYSTIVGNGGNADGGGCKVTYETTGDFARLGRIWDGLLMRQKMYDKDGKVTMIQQVTSLSQAKLDNSIFAIPQGYTKLSVEDYNKKRQQAMMQAMMGGGGNNNSARNTNNNNNNDRDTDDTQNRDQEKKKKKKRGFGFPKLPF